MKPYKDKESLVDIVRSIVRQEIDEAIKKLKNGKVNSYSSIMKNTKIDANDIYSSIPSFANTQNFNNKNTYQKMKNKINYGISTDSKSYVNKAGTKTNK